MVIISIENLSFKYNGSNEFALKDICLQVERGEFVVICGESGCGKSTLLRLMKKAVAPKGEISGCIRYENTPLDELDARTAACKIGFVTQNPENQIVTDKVWHELAFGLESMGESTGSIRRKTAEISGYFGINEWYRKRTDELSGGQKQLLNLASVMVMRPDVLLLDEPTSRLDPIAASQFINTLKKLNDELGLTVILAEHRLEDVLPIADKAIVMNKAAILLRASPAEIGQRLNKADPNHSMQFGLPTPVRVFRVVGGTGNCPLTVREGRDYLENNFTNDIRSLENFRNTQNSFGLSVNFLNFTQNAGETKRSENGLKSLPGQINERGNECAENKRHARKRNEEREKAVEIREAFFRYERNTPDVLDDLSLDVYENEFLCILGANGAGKSTLLNIIAGLSKPYRGRLRIFGKKISEYGGVSLYRDTIAYLPQNPQLVFIKSKLADDLAEVTNLLRISKEQAQVLISNVCTELGIEHLLQMHPYDLSGGEQQKAALAKLLLLSPRLILLDEPTKGIDAYSKTVLAKILSKLKSQGRTIITVTHDVEFAAEYADMCAMFFDGKIVSKDAPEVFFSENNYYTTSASRMSRGFFDRAVTARQIVDLCKLNKSKEIQTVDKP